MAYDASFELLSARQLTGVVRFKARSGPDWQRLADGYRLLVLDSLGAPRLARYFERVPGARTLFAGGGVAVVLRPAAGTRAS